MDAMNFAYWLNGFAELTGDEPPTAAQWKGIKEHLALVFKKVTAPVEFPYRGVFSDDWLQFEQRKSSSAPNSVC